MSRKSDAVSHPAGHSSWQWWAGVFLVAGTLGFGFWGLRSYESARGGVPDMGSVLYATLQLFILNSPYLERPIPWQLDVGRILGASVFFVFIERVLRALLPGARDEWLRMPLRSPWAGGHVVVCGLGDLGLRLALEGRRRGRRIVAIEKSSAPLIRDLARRRRILVLDGDASSVDPLQAAKVDRADFVLAVCSDDHTNLAVAAAVGELVTSRPRNRTPLVCRLLIQDPRTRALLDRHPIVPSSGPYRVNFSDLDRHAIAARQAFRQYPLDFQPIHEDDDTVVHLVVIGLTNAGQSLTLHAARIGHFANEVGRGKRLRVTVVDPRRSALKEFKTGHPALDLVCDTKSWTRDPASPQFVRALARLSPSGGPAAPLVTYAFCWEGREGDEANFRLGVELAQQVGQRRARILVLQTSRVGYAALLSAKHVSPEVTGRVHAFGMIEDIFTWDVVLHESEDKLACALHEDFRAKRLAAGDPGPHLPGWGELNEGFRGSNRHAADHIPIKLRALGYHEAASRKDKVNIKSFAPQEVELLAKMEHARFCAERWLDGWTWGPKTIREKKISRALVPWKHLPPGEQSKDHEQILAIPDALSRIGFGIYR